MDYTTNLDYVINLAIENITEVYEVQKLLDKCEFKYYKNEENELMKDYDTTVMRKEKVNDLIESKNDDKVQEFLNHFLNHFKNGSVESMLFVAV